jgi:DNA-binding CsgD family transcriptional regulator
MDIQARILQARTALLECLSLAELATCAERLGSLLDASQTLVYRCEARSELAFLGGSLTPLMPAYAPYRADDPVHPYMRGEANSYLLIPRTPWNELLRSAAYSEFYTRHDVHHMCGVRPTPFRYGEPGMFGFLFTRARKQLPFGANHERAFELLEPDLRAAWSRAHRTAELRRDAALLPDVAVQRLQSEVVALLDEQGLLLWITPGAERLWAKPTSAELRAALSAAARDSLGPAQRGYPLPLRGQLAGQPVLCDVAVLRRNLDQPCCRVRLSIDVARRVALQHGLTPSQARTLAHLAKGSSTRSMAAALRVSEHTIRSHVAQIRQKTSLRTRGEIVTRYTAMSFFELA